MADKFKDYETPICSDWLNTVDDAVFDALLEPKTPDEARTNIGAVNGEEVVIIGDAHYSQLGHNHDHGQLDGLADDDHTQYHNDTRGDARYSQLGHDHPEYIGDAPVDGNSYVRKNAAWALETIGGGGVTDHGALTGLADDDHTQYYNQTRGDARYSQLSHGHDHGTLTGLADDDHTQYYNQTRGDARYSQLGHGHSEYIGEAPIDDNYYARRNAAWELSPTGGGGGVTDHGALTGLADDDHTQYHNDTRGDARYSPLGHTHPGGASYRRYAIYEESTAPAPGELNVEIINANNRVFRVSDTDYDGAPVNLSLALPGDNLTLTDDPDSPPVTGFARYVVIDPVIDHGTYFEVTAVRTDTSGSQGVTDGTLIRASLTLSAGSGTSETDHGALTGLADDDHTQYHNDTRGDARYVPLSRSISGVASIGGGGDLSQNRAFSLVNDSLIPGANQTYGTDANGERGWFSRTTTTVYSGTWTFQNPTTPPPTGASIRRNNTTPENVTQVYVTETDADGINQTAVFGRLIADDKLAVRLESDQALSVEYRLTGPGSDNGSFWTFPVEYVSGTGASVADGTRVDVYFIHGEVSDHGTLTGLADDDHTQYYNQTRGDARYSQTSHNHDHGALTGLADDDHTQYYNQSRGDARYSQTGHTHSHASITDRNADDSHPQSAITGLTYDLAVLESRPRKNFIINGNFDIWQRGSNFTTPSLTSFSADRWLYTVTNTSVTRQAVDGELTGSYYSLRLVSSGASWAKIATRLESIDSAKLRFKTVTLSCYAKLVSGSLKLSTQVATAGTYDNFGTTNTIYEDSVGKTLTSSWVKYSWTFEVTSQARFGLQIQLYMMGTGTATMEFGQVQLEIGDEASDFEHEHVADTLARCLRYYQEFPETIYGNITQINFATDQGTRGVVKDLPVAMRIAPTTTQTITNFTAGYVGHTTTSLVWAETAWATVTNLASVSAVKATAELT